MLDPLGFQDPACWVAVVAEAIRQAAVLFVFHAPIANRTCACHCRHTCSVHSGIGPSKSSALDEHAPRCVSRACMRHDLRGLAIGISY